MPLGIYTRRKNTLVGKNPNSRNGWKKGENYRGMLGKHHSEETKRKMSESQKKTPHRYWLGKKRPNIAKNMRERIISEETRKKMSVAKKGSKMPPRSKEHLKKLSENNSHYWLGKKQSLETRIKRSNATVGIMPKNIQRIGKYGNVQRGWFQIGNKRMFFRSKWEANYALYLNFLIKQNQIKKWEFEKDVFIFHKIQFGTRSYRPDFKVFNHNGSYEYHEIKGYMDDKSKTKIKRMAKYYPEIKLIVIEKDSYYDIRKKIGKVAGFYE